MDRMIQGSRSTILEGLLGRERRRRTRRRSSDIK
jgi:hypothetical protein